MQSRPRCAFLSVSLPSRLVWRFAIPALSFHCQSREWRSPEATAFLRVSGIPFQVSLPSYLSSLPVFPAFIVKAEDASSKWQ